MADALLRLQELDNLSVFQINDVLFKIPPSNISIQQEDLIYQAKALRTNVTTKTPSGHGHCSVQVVAYIKYEQILDLHRLILQIQNSPFCYVENRLIRETIVPTWNFEQSMAFTCIGLTVAPMPGQSDVMVLQLDLMWFNYQPFVHNFLYRQDWLTDWIGKESGTSEQDSVRATIGWDIDKRSFKRTYKPVIVASSLDPRDAQEGQGLPTHREHNVITAEYVNTAIRTIEQMESLHPGEFFDLMPVPDNMSPAAPVSNPLSSRIYVRYCNLLQRDALLRNFKIDIEADLVREGIADYFFGLGRDDRGAAVTLSLNNPLGPTAVVTKWKELSAAWVAQMNQWNGGIEYAFCTYRDVKMSDNWNAAVHKAMTRPAQEAGVKANVEWWESVWESGTLVDEKTKKPLTSPALFAVRKGMSEPALTHIPIGTSVGELANKVGDRVHWRSSETLSEIYDKTVEGRMHEGTDFSYPVGTPVYAVKSGTIHVDESPNEYMIYDSSSGEVFPASGVLVDFKNAVIAELAAGLQPIRPGEAYKLLALGQGMWDYFYLFVQFGSSGRSIKIEHENGEMSFYYHLNTITPGLSGRYVSPEEVTGGFQIATSGQSGPFKPERVIGLIGKSEEQVTDFGSDAFGYPRMDELWQLTPHLHFEFWEPSKFHTEREPPLPKGEVRALRRGRTSYTLVDPVPTLDAAKDKSGTSMDGAVPQLQAAGVEEVLAETLSDDDVWSVMGMLKALADDGWNYYQEDSAVRNIWYKPQAQQIFRGNAQDLTDGSHFRTDTLVLTNCGAGMRHVVSNIPLLGQEFPTQQHLGSIEPFYTFEFASIDDSVNNTGISTNAQLLLGMRSVLQYNARRFRPVIDGWCLAANTFLTRLFGSYIHNDIQIEEGVNPAEKRTPGDYVMKRRLICTRANSENVEGNPGLTSHFLEMSETNPYEVQTLNAAAKAKELSEDARKDILTKLYNLDFASKFSGFAAEMLIADLAGAQLSAPGSSDYGTFKLFRPLSDELTGEVGIVKDDLDGEGPRDWIYVRNTDAVEKALANNGQDRWYKPVYNDSGAEIGDTGYLFLDPSTLPFRRGASVDQSTKGVKPAVVLAGRDRAPAPALVEVPVPGYVSFSLETLASGSEEERLAATVPWQRISDYHNELMNIIGSANMMMFEGESILTSGEITPGMVRGVLRDQLYDLPVDPKGWRYLQALMRRVALKYSTDGRGYAFMTNDNKVAGYDTNWITWDEQLTSADEALIDGAVDDLGLSVAGFFANVADTASMAPGVGTGARVLAGGAAQAYGQSSDRGLIATRYLGLAIHGIIDLVELPARALGLVEGEWSSALVYLSEVEATHRQMAGTLLGRLPTASPAATYVDSVVTSFNNTFVKPIIGELKLDDLSNPLATTNDRWRTAIASSGMFDSTRLTASIFVHSNSLTGGERVPYASKPGAYQLYVPSTAFKWEAVEADEQAKAKYFQGLLARLAEWVANEPEIMIAFGLEVQAELLNNQDLKGSPAYPDIVLPFHPYFGDINYVAPDFYMWNIYQDGGVFAQDVEEDMKYSLEFVLTNAHASMGKLNDKYDPENQHNVDLKAPHETQTFGGFNPEGKEGMSTVFYEVEGDDVAIDAFFSDKNLSGDATTTKALKSQRAKGVTLDAGEGYFGAGSNGPYAPRAGDDTYTRLRLDWDSFESDSMFGSRAGFQEKTEEAAGRQTGTALETPTEFNHRFDVTQLKNIAAQSSKDIRSQKMTMRRAYPTFKLYFIEEDEFESRLLNFDDFHSYNGVVSFTVVQDRKDAAETAIITVQNISGTLDGTRRNTVTDLDYFSDDSTISKNKSAGDSSNEDTNADQPFGAIVLRPGLNVQLRAGYSNNPEELEVLINGRVVDLTWNKQADQAEIMVQGFGAELVQVLKGTAFHQHPEPYFTTHELLGSLMLEPELMHFGRWEFGRRFQQGENNDHRIDFTDYSQDTFSGKLGWTKLAMESMGNHPWLTAAIAIGGAAVVGTAAARWVPGVSGLVRKAAIWGPTAGFLEKYGIAATYSEEYFRAGLITAAESTAARGTVITGATRIGRLEAAAVFELPEAQHLFNTVSRAGGTALAESVQLSRANIVEEVFEKVAGGTASIDEVAAAFGGYSTSAQGAVLRGQWLLDPLLTNQHILQSVGFRPVSVALGGLVYNIPQLILTAGAVGLALDAFTNTFGRPLYENSIGRVEKYFSAVQVSLFMNPQDDNLFIPHPKDYMSMGAEGWLTWAAKGAAYIGVSAFSPTASSISEVQGVVDYMVGTDIWDKRVKPAQCQYFPFNSTIWDIFHEMSLRHPGWIYGTRPYGKEFRYTMFFGLPSQRYWSRSGSNEFVTRMNHLYDYIKSDGGIAEAEYRALYGDKTETGKNLTEFIQETVAATKPVISGTSGSGSGNGNSTTSSGGAAVSSSGGGSSSKASNSAIAALLTGRALKEYMLGIQTRFVPFRRYHNLTSERDIVWNGIMGSENATSNAVDIMYFSEEEGETISENGKVIAQPTGTAFFKAHSKIPPYKVRTHVVDNYPNCRGYSMAMRYAMGVMMYDLRDMYRGEIIVLGNPRIRPWDVAVLLDSYNDMVGPIEIERVVHNFSHETGFITELKPSAMVFANEISGYPILTAMKTMSLALKDIEDRFSGLAHGNAGESSAGLARRTLDAILNLGSTANKADLDDRVGRAFEAQYPDGLAGAEAAGQIPDLKAVNDALNTAGHVFDGLAVAGGALVTLGAAATGHYVGGVSGAKLAFGSLAAGGVAIFGAERGAASVLGAAAPATAMWLLGGPLLMLNCFRGDSVILVPLMKSGEPIVAGITYHDPAVMWNEFKGEVARYIDDYVSGTRDVLDLWKLYGTEAWRHLLEDSFWDPKFSDKGVQTMNSNPGNLRGN